CICIKDDHAMIEVSVGYKQLISFRINKESGWPSQIRRVVAALVLSGMPDLEQQFAFGCELQDLVVFLRAAAEPDIIFGIDKDSVLRCKPFVAFPGPAPRLKKLPVLIEFQNRRRGNAALCLRRIERGRLLTIGNSGRPME